MEVEYIKGLGCPVNINWGKEVRAITIEDAKQLQAKLAEVIEQAEKEPELSEFEKAVYDCAWGKVTCKTDGESKEEYAKRHAATLLALAIDARANELSEGLNQSKLDKDSIPYHLIEFMCNLYDCQNWKEIEGLAELYVTRIKAAAMKDLPRWKEANKTCFVGDALIKDCYGTYFSSTAKEGSIYILKSELEKLPGFKEDYV